jgi:TonB-linked SusC/RagA family outer membrane protein
MKKSFLITLALLCLSVGVATAQTVNVQGVVTSADDGEPVIGASVKVEGTTLGGITDIDGKFSLSNIPSSAKTLEVSYVGMLTQQVTVKPGTLKIVLQSDNKMLDEVMVVAYGTAKKSAFTGSAGVVKSDRLEKRVVSNVTQALSGQVAGVQIYGSDGAPGSSANIRVRGVGSLNASNSPLYVVDGVPFDGAISSINPSDIASMTVLKDAAANAIYGARGANGVILITTKSGSGNNGEAKITVDAKWGSNHRAVPNYSVMKSPAEYYETMYRALYNSQIYAGETPDAAYQYANKELFERHDSKGNVVKGGLGYHVFTVPEGQDFIGRDFKLNPNATLGYSDSQYYYTPDNWYNEIFGKGNFRQEYNVTISGKSDKLNYFASVGYLDDNGIIKNSGFTRYSGRGKVDYQAKKWLKVGTNMSYSQLTKHQTGSTSWGSSGNLFYLSNMIAPIYPLYVRNPDGTIMRDPNTGNIKYDNGASSTNAIRPFSAPSKAAAGVAYDNATDIVTIFSGKWYAEITPIEGLKLTADIAATESNERDSYLSSRFGSSDEQQDGSVEVSHERLSAINTQYLASYSHSFANVHNFDLLVGYEQYRLKKQYLDGKNTNLYNPGIGELGNAAGSASKDVTSYTNNYMTEGILSRLQYNYDGKYFFSASYRRDASSRFAKDHRWGNFGSLGGAWLMTREKFMDSTSSWLDMLKVKVSWGIQGNDNLYSNGNYYYYTDQFKVDYNSETGYSKTYSYIGNPDLTWETSYSFNAGVDFELFKGRLTGSLEYYSRKTGDMLYEKPVPLSSGNPLGHYPINVGSLLNNGVELDLNGIILRNKNLEWAVNFNLTSVHSEITKLDEDVIKNGGIKYSSSIIRIGGSSYESYLKSYAGVDKETGLALYYIDPDNNNYETTTDWSKAKLADQGNTLAKVYGGFGTTLSWKGFDFSMQLSYQLGGRIYDGSYQALMHSGYNNSSGVNWSTDIRDAWTPEHTNTNIPRLDASIDTDQKDSNRFLISSDFLSFNNVTFGYTLPASLLNPIGISSLRFFVTGDNLGVISARKGLDPRISLGKGSSTSSGNYTYSAMRNISGGISLTF